MAVADGAMIKKQHVALFLNGGTENVPTWRQISKSVDNTITMNPETQTYDFIVDESPSTELIRYQPSLSQPITMYKGKEDYEFAFDKFFSQAVGADAHSEVLIVFLGADKNGNSKAWRSKCILIADNMNPVDSTITVDIPFSGTTKKGVVDSSLVFTEDGSGIVEVVQTLKVSDGSAVEDATVEINGVKKQTNVSGEVLFILTQDEKYAITAYKGAEIGSILLTVSTGTSETITIE